MGEFIQMILDSMDTPTLDKVVSVTRNYMTYLP